MSLRDEFITKEDALTLYKMFGNNAERLSVSMFENLLYNLPSEDVVPREPEVGYKLPMPELVNLLISSNKLAALQEAGVQQNGDWYNKALKDYLKKKFQDNHPLYKGTQDYYYNFEELALEELNGYK